MFPHLYIKPHEELFELEAVHEKIAHLLWGVRISPPKEEYRGQFFLKPKRFTVVRSDLEDYQVGQEHTMEGQYITERMPGMGRVFFLPETIHDGKHERFIEVKGYGQDGRNICLWKHWDGDIKNGIFFKNARKEYNILNKAFAVGLRVPKAVLLGKISKEEWFKSGKIVAERVFETDLSAYGPKNNKQLEAHLKSIDAFAHEHILNNPLSAYKQPYNAGIVIRAPLSPFRLGDPSETYELHSRNTFIATKCGQTFYKLLDLGYLHLCPGTGNMTTMAELTDMTDCYDLKKDKNLQQIINNREADEEVETNFWEDLIGPRHTGNLSPYFIQGMLGKEASLEEAAQELKNKVQFKLTEYGKSF